MSEWTRLKIKRFAGMEIRAEEYLARKHSNPQLSRAEKDAVILLGMRFLENLSESRLRRVGYSLIQFLAQDYLLPHAATYLKDLVGDPYNWTNADLVSAQKWIVGELRQFNAKPPRDAIQKRLDWVAEEAGLNSLDQQVLGVLVRAKTIAEYGWLLTYRSPYLHDPEDVHLISLVAATGCHRRAIEDRLTPSAPLIASALVEDIDDHEFVATPFAIKLARLRTKSPEVTRRAFREGIAGALAEPARVYSVESVELVAI